MGLLDENLVYSLYENNSFCGDRILMPSGIYLQKAFLYADNASLELVKCVDMTLMSSLHWIIQILERHREKQITGYERCYQVGMKKLVASISKPVFFDIHKCVR